MLDHPGVIQWQARRIEELEAEVAYWRAIATPAIDVPFTLSQQLGLTSQQARVLAAIYNAKPYAGMDALLVAMDTRAECENSVLCVRVSQIRLMFRKMGVPGAIKNMRGLGYALSQEARDVVAKALGQNKQAKGLTR